MAGAASHWLEETRMEPARDWLAVNPSSRWMFRPGMILAAQAQLWAACTCTTSLNTKSLRQLPMAAALVCQEIFSAVD